MQPRDPVTGYLVNHWPTLSKALEKPNLRTLSLGVGVQSVTMAEMAARGEIGPMPDYAIFADPKWESPLTYQYYEDLIARLPFPVLKTSKGDIRQAIVDGKNSTGQRFASVPWFIRNPDGSQGMGKRQCTKEFKLEPITALQRRLLGYEPGVKMPRSTRVEVWIGISMDEAVRMKPSRHRWQVNRWPLIEANMTRQDCIRWLQERQIQVPPKSACIGCPFHTNAMWRDMRQNRPEEWLDAVAVDRALREGGDSGRFYKMRGLEFMHRSLLPLDQAPLEDDHPDQLGFDLECEGMCGV